MNSLNSGERLSNYKSENIDCWDSPTWFSQAAPRSIAPNNERTQIAIVTAAESIMIISQGHYHRERLFRAILRAWQDRFWATLALLMNVWITN